MFLFCCSMKPRLKNYARKLPLALGLVLLIVLFGLSACKTNKQTALPTPDPKYEDPLRDPVYRKAVMENEPEFTEAELLKAMADLQPIPHYPMRHVLDQMTRISGWERNRAYYVLYKSEMAEYVLSAPENKTLHPIEFMPTAKEFDLVRKNLAAVQKGIDR